MPKNDSHDPIITEMILFQHGGYDLHGLKVKKMNNLSSKSDSAHLMPKNDMHDPLLIELLLFQHGGHDLHDAKVNKMNNLSRKSNSAHPKCIK